MARRRAYLAALVPLLATGALIVAPTASASGSKPTHPDADYLGSTVRAHEGGTARSMSTQSAAASGNAAGFDVSHYQGTVDWTGAKNNGASFAYMKATEGTDYTDP
ncbi:GH25 family lysozyme, partial [Amycolatopsis sp.]|uniref:GH25 family lysozyme n=1 Tax=Amycolatopsis sp. TaxID=37632 RepID=UPI002B65C03F